MDQSPTNNLPKFLTDKNSWIRKALEKVSGLNQVLDIYDQMEHRESPESFVQEVLQLLNITVKFEEKELERITSSGPVIVVCNHPQGALDGLILAHLLLSVRKDIRFMANPILGMIEELRDIFFFIEPYNDPTSMRKNVASVRQSVDWLKSGGLLALFPSGEVAHRAWNRWEVKESLWNDSVSKIVRKTKATVVPIRIDGNNSEFFHGAGLIHPALRTLFLPRELVNKKNKTIEVRIGKPISFDRLPVELSDRDLVEYFRFRSNLLNKKARKQDEKKNQKRNVFSTAKQRISSHEGTHLLVKEIEQIPPENLLSKSNTHAVYFATANQIPHLLNEIGRLREKTFRRVGEGTGLQRDLDEFDSYYTHLFVWNLEFKEMVGAYRIGKTDEIIRDRGIQGLYTSKLFEFGDEFIKTVHPGLELGRSFVRPKYQKAMSSLSLLWKGIAKFAHQNPQYRYLFGPVSISNDYSLISKNLIVDFIHKNSFDTKIAQVVQGRMPFRKHEFKKEMGGVDIQSFVREMDDLSDLVSELETEFDGVPILLKHYLRLGGKLLAFNVDKNFENCLDGLIRIDLLKANEKMIQMYMGKSEYEEYRNYHNSIKEKGDTSKILSHC